MNQCNLKYKNYLSSPLSLHLIEEYKKKATFYKNELFCGNINKLIFEFYSNDLKSD